MNDFEKWGRFGIPMFCYPTNFLPYETSLNQGIGFYIYRGKITIEVNWTGKRTSRTEFDMFPSPLETQLGIGLYGNNED